MPTSVSSLALSFSLSCHRLSSRLVASPIFSCALRSLLGRSNLRSFYDPLAPPGQDDESDDDSASSADGKKDRAWNNQVGYV